MSQIEPLVTFWNSSKVTDEIQIVASNHWLNQCLIRLHFFKFRQKSKKNNFQNVKALILIWFDFFQYRNIKITLVNNPSPRSIDNMGNSSLHDDELNSWTSNWIQMMLHQVPICSNQFVKNVPLNTTATRCTNFQKCFAVIKIPPYLVLII